VSLSSANQIQSIPSNFISLRSILLLPFHLRLDLPSGLSIQALQSIILGIHISPMRLTGLVHLILLDLIILIFAEQYKLWSSDILKELKKNNVNIELPKSLSIFLLSRFVPRSSSSITSRLGPTGPFRDSYQVNLSSLVLFSALEQQVASLLPLQNLYSILIRLLEPSSSEARETWVRNMAAEFCDDTFGLVT
jgi:hypothetical protein